MKQLLLLSLLFLFSNITNAQGWGETQKITPDDRALADEYGNSVSILNNIAVVGAKSVDGSSNDFGAVYIYQKDASNIWLETQKLFSSAPWQFDRFGVSVDLDENYLIVGARSQDYDVNGNNFIDSSGAAYIFEKDTNGDWIEVQKLVASDRESFQPLFGETVAIDGNYAVINAPREKKGLAGQDDIDGAGACYIFERDTNGVWNEVQKIVASDRNINDRFGDFATTIYGDVIVVGSFRHDYDASSQNEISSAGAVYIFERGANGVWSEVQKIVASDREQGEWFGRSVAIQDNLLMVGASQEYLQGDLNAQYGAVYVFERDVNGTYNEIQKIRPNPLIHESKFGHSIDIDNNNMIIGAHLMNIGSVNFGGAAFMFEKDSNGIWEQTAIMYDEDVNSGDDFGFDVAISGDFAFVGAFEQDEDEMGLNPLSQAGAAYVFDVNAPNNLGTLSITEDNFGDSLKVYPNPNQGSFTVNLGKIYNQIDISITNSLGQFIQKHKYQSLEEVPLDINADSGVYFIKISTENGKSALLKMIKL